MSLLYSLGDVQFSPVRGDKEFPAAKGEGRGGEADVWLLRRGDLHAQGSAASRVGSNLS